MWLAGWTVALCWASVAGSPAGVVVEAVRPQSASAAAGLQPGDVLLSWSRAATPANPQPARGTIESPFDVAYLWSEQAPRGDIALMGRRGPEAASWVLPTALPPGLTVRPDLPAQLLALYQDGKGLLEAKKVAEGAERHRAAAAQARASGGWLVSTWFLARAGEALAGARLWPQADAAYAEAAGAAEGHLTPLIAGQLHRVWAITYDSREDWVQVAAHGRRALALEEAQDPESLRVASALNVVAGAAAHRMELAAAEEALRRALRIIEKAVPDTVRHANLLHNVGAVLQARHELSSAEDYYRRALAIRERVLPGNSDVVAASVLNLGKIALQRGDVAKAEEYLGRSLAMSEQADPESLDVALCLRALGDVAMERRDLGAAESHYRRALGLVEKLAPGSLSVSEDWRLLGDVARERGELEVAEEHYRRALAIVEKLHHGTSDEAETLYALGVLQRQRGRTAEAAGPLLQALDALESQRARVGGDEEGRAGFFAPFAPYYHDAMEVLVELGRPAEALHVLERSRARSLLTLFAERDVVFSSELPPELAAERRRTDAEYDQVQASLSQLDATRGRAKIDELVGRLRELRTVQEEIAIRIRRASPRFASVQYPQPLELAGIRATLDPGTLFLGYSVGKEKTLLFAVEAAGAPGPGLSIFSLPVGEGALREKVAALRQRIQRPAAATGALDAQAAELYDLLLRPAEPRLAASERLLVSPDGPLHSLPLGALVRREGRTASFLIEWKPLLVAGSATVHAELKKLRRPGSADSGQLVAFGDPRYPAPAKTKAAAVRDAEVRSVVGGGFPLAPLPSTRIEVEDIAALFPGRARKYLGEDATEGRAKSPGGDARYLHFACHATLDERFPLNSAVALTIREKPAEGEDNGLLQAWEIFDRVRIQADLVTLSACNTALGTEMGGEGLLGLRRAFHYAGARAVLASLWAVPDRSTAVLMKRFYGHLKDGLSLDQALRGAQVDLIHTRGLSHPYRWAAFQLSGDWR